MAESIYDLVVIGGGPAGYAAAIRAGQLGKKVACVELERAGGTCLNWGCIPSKALLKTAELYQKMLNAEKFGLKCKGVDVDFEQVITRSRNVADQMGKGIEFLFKKNKVDYFLGKAQLVESDKVEIIEGKDKGKSLSTKNVLIATGCTARRLPGVEVDGKKVLTSREALALKTQPKSIIILGAGAIGAEFAYFYNSLGTQVTLMEMLPRALPVEDEEVSATLERAFKKQGMDLKMGAKAEDIKVSKEGVTIKGTQGDKAFSLKADSLLIAIGVAPNLDGVLKKGLQLALDAKGYVQVGKNYETSLKNVYAAGDIIGPPWLAHVATYEAIQAVNGMFSVSEPKRVTLYPACTYCQPQVASVGLTEQRAKEKGIAYKVGKFPFTASGKAVASNEAEGFVKLIVSEEHGEILGAHIIGSEATELIAEYTLGMHLEATTEEIHATIHAHPTLSEALAEAAAATSGEAIHI